MNPPYSHLLSTVFCLKGIRYLLLKKEGGEKPHLHTVLYVKVYTWYKMSDMTFRVY